MQQIPLPKQLKIAFLAGAGCTQRQIVYRTETSLGTVNKYVKIDMPKPTIIRKGKVYH